MEYTKIGSLRVSRIGFGAWAIGGHGYGPKDDATSIAAVHRALDLGINFFDTADVYGLGHSEEVLGRVLRGRKDVVIATKFGVMVDASGKSGRDASPAHLARALEGSLRRLGADRIPLYQIHWPDPKTPISETISVLVELRKQGKIGEIGCSNFPTQTLRQMPVVAVQGGYSMIERGVEGDLLPYCREAGIAFLAFDVLAKGLLTGRFNRDSRFGPEDARSRDPNFQGERLARNLALVDSLKGGARTPAQQAIRWVLERGASCALVGASTPAQVEENAGALYP